MPTNKVVVVDLDGTLCDIRHRVHLAQEGDWNGFHSLLVNDEPHKEIVRLLEALETAEIPYFVCSGRDESFMNHTKKWFAKHNIPAPFVIMLRPATSHAPDHELKIKMLEEHFGGKENVLERVLFVLEDREKVVVSMRDYGLTVLQVREGTY